MGRPERPVDPDAGPVQRLAHELRCLRREAGSPSYRVMAQRARVSVTALSRAASGERLPSAAVVRAYAQACGADPDVWEQRWKAAAEEATPYCAAEGESPYQGLARFEPGDRDLFFGRDRLAEDAVRLLREHRFAVVLGASGSGKSSLLRAGVVPRLQTLLRESDWDAELRLITPGARPAATFGRLLAPRGDGPERLVLVDQFEEIFTLCRDRADRWRFVDQLLLAREPGSRLRVVVAVGGNFHGRCVEHPGLAEALQSATLPVRPMTREELREAVVGPATAAGLRVERELTARIVEEAADQPGALPLLSHALRETWRRRRSGLLTLAAYEEVGGVHGAIAAAAEEVYGRLSPAQALTAQRLLLALITPGDGTADTRRPLGRAELREWPDPEVPAVLERLARARLVTLDEDHVELAHDALITGWPRLQGWIEKNRERMRQHRHLSEAARGWQEHGRDPGALYRGARLAVADALFARGRNDDDLTGRERAFLSASRVAHSMERWTADRARGRVRKLLLALCLVLVGALTAGHVALHESRAADWERSRAAARHAAALAGRVRRVSPRTGMLLGVAAWRLARLPDSRAALFGALTDPVRDVFTDPAPGDGTQDFLTDSGRTLLAVGGGRWSAWDVATHRRTGSGRLPDVPVTAVSPDGRTLALSGGGGRRLWHLPLGGHGGAGYSRTAAAGPVLGFGADGRSYAVGGVGLGPGSGSEPGSGSGSDVAPGSGSGPGAVPDSGSGPGSGSDVVPGPDSGSGAQLRALADDRVLFETSATGAVVPSADGRLVAVCEPGRPLAVRDTATRQTRQGAWQSFRAPDCSLTALAFGGEGTRLAALSDTGIRVWDTASGRLLADITHRGDRHLALTADGMFLAAAGQGGTTVWRISAPDAPVFRRPVDDGPVTALAWDPGSPTLRYLAGAAVHSLDLAAPLTARWLDRPLDEVLLSPDGRLLATAERHAGGYRFRLRDAATGRPVTQLPEPPAGPGPSTHPLMAFAPDGRALAYGLGTPSAAASTTGLVVWDVPGHRTLATPAPGGPSAGAVRSIALTPGGRQLLVSRATSTGSPTGEVWDVRRGTRTNRSDALHRALKAVLASGFAGPVTALPHGLRVGVPLGGGADAQVVAVSRDGTRVATGGAFGGVTVWEGRTVRHRAAVVPAPSAPPDCAACVRVTSLAFSPDGRTLAAGYGSGALRLWDVATQQPLGDSLSTPGDAIRSLAFSADATSVHAGSGHVPVQRYPLAPSRIVAQLCARAGRTLTRSEWHTYLPEVPYRPLCDTSDGERYDTAHADTARDAAPPGPSPAGSAPVPGPARTPAPPRGPARQAGHDRSAEHELRTSGSRGREESGHGGHPRTRRPGGHHRTGTIAAGTASARHGRHTAGTGRDTARSSPATGRRGCPRRAGRPGADTANSRPPQGCFTL